ncbi:MAG: hypothetical protein ACRCXB_23025 [Aeromonadaceae bacterium]
MGNKFNVSDFFESTRNKVLNSRKCGQFVILENKGLMDKIRFLDTGTELWFPRSSVAIGALRDPCIRDKYGVGYMGVGDNGSTIIDSWGKVRKSPAYTTWRAMIARCYGGAADSYSDVTVCERWHNFQNFCEDLPTLPGYSMWRDYHLGIRPDGIIELDKDAKATPGHQKQYSPETCVFLTKRDNLRVRWNRYRWPEGVIEAPEADGHPA